MFDLIEICGMSREGALLESFKVAKFPMIVEAIVIMLIVLFVGLNSVEDKKSKSRIWKIVLLSSVFAALYVAINIMFPGTIINFLDGIGLV